MTRLLFDIAQENNIKMKNYSCEKGKSTCSVPIAGMITDISFIRTSLCEILLCILLTNKAKPFLLTWQEVINHQPALYNPYFWQILKVAKVQMQHFELHELVKAYFHLCNFLNHHTKKSE